MSSDIINNYVMSLSADRFKMQTGDRFIFCPVNPLRHRGFGIQLYVA